MREVLRLRRILDLPVKPVERPAEKCELCNLVIGPRHPHVVDVESRRLMCACRPCYLLFTQRGAAGGRYHSVSERYLKLDESAVDWEMFDIPAGIAFFMYSTAQKRLIAFYPSPGGATESGVSIEAWDEVVRRNPEIGGVEPDIEAVLVCHRRDRNESWIVPVDACYELVGRIRRYWKGFDGGEEAKREIDAFFAELRQRDQWGAPCST